MPASDIYLPFFDKKFMNASRASSDCNAIWKSQVFLTGDPFSSEFAKEVGLIAEVNENPKARIGEFAAKIVAQPPNAVIQTKALLKSEMHDKVSAVMIAEGELFQMALQSD
ncbi:MAG: hypothetical protein EB069_09260, partial [Actinobacteria bacterium]|nr:hypothetical protein [Actinomycetota bacterium]